MATRNRVIYQSEAVYTTVAAAYDVGQGIAQATKDLQRVQSANYSFNISRTDVNQFGQLGAIDRIITESPSVSFDTSYLLANMANEARLGFYVTPSGAQGPFRSCITNLTDSTNANYLKNFYILNAKEGKDADVTLEVSDSGQYESIIGIGNAGLTSYAIEAAVGGFPTVSVSAEGMNMDFYTGPQGTGLPVGVSGASAATRPAYYISGVSPAINPVDGTRLDPETVSVALPAPTGNAGGQNAAKTAVGEVSVLRPGDLRLFLSKQTTDNVGRSAVSTSMNNPDYAGMDIADAHIQSFNISFDLSRSPIEQLGTKFAYARLIDFPITVSLGIDAIVSDLTTGSLAEIIDCDGLFDARIQLNSPDCGEAVSVPDRVAANYILKGIKLDSQSFSLGMGDNKTASLSFSSQIGGPEQSGLGLFMSGYTGHVNG
tara:strand:+ start:641 stop:1930 length:1290 start_codon:yes stop_codon:yes gene_type:complete